MSGTATYYYYYYIHTKLLYQSFDLFYLQPAIHCCKNHLKAAYKVKNSRRHTKLINQYSTFKQPYTEHGIPSWVASRISMTSPEVMAAQLEVIQHCFPHPHPGVGSAVTLGGKLGMVVAEGYLAAWRPESFPLPHPQHIAGSERWRGASSRTMRSCSCSWRAQQCSSLLGSPEQLPSAFASGARV